MQIGGSPLRVAGVNAGLTESNGSLPSGLWFTSPAGWLPRTGISSGTLLSVIEYGLALLLPFLLRRLSDHARTHDTALTASSTFAFNRSYLFSFVCYFIEFTLYVSMFSSYLVLATAFWNWLLNWYVNLCYCLELDLYIGWQWCNFVPYLSAGFLRHLVGKTLRNAFTLLSHTLCRYRSMITWTFS